MPRLYTPAQEREFCKDQKSRVIDYVKEKVIKPQEDACRASGKPTTLDFIEYQCPDPLFEVLKDPAKAEYPVHFTNFFDAQVKVVVVAPEVI
jgi:hypothetical protein